MVLKIRIIRLVSLSQLVRIMYNICKVLSLNLRHRQKNIKIIQHSELMYEFRISKII